MQPMSRIGAGAALCLAALGVAASPATAAPSEPIEALPPLTEDSLDYGVTRAELIELSEVQSAAEIQAIIEGDKPAIALADDYGNVIAAVQTPPPTISTYAIVLDTPYTCSGRPSSACIHRAGSTDLPYRGPGTLSISVTNAKALSAGSILTAFTRESGTVHNVPATPKWLLATNAHITRITR